jgi:branched-chain amino acid transport system permease protein
MTYLITQTLNGLFSAALLFLIASALTLVFGVMRIVNIAHGSFFMLGVYVAHTIVSRTRTCCSAGWAPSSSSRRSVL